MERYDPPFSGAWWISTISTRVGVLLLSSPSKRGFFPAVDLASAPPYRESQEGQPLTLRIEGRTDRRPTGIRFLMPGHDSYRRSYPSQDVRTASDWRGPLCSGPRHLPSQPVRLLGRSLLLRRGRLWRMTRALTAIRGAWRPGLPYRSDRPPSADPWLKERSLFLPASTPWFLSHRPPAPPRERLKRASPEKE